MRADLPLVACFGNASRGDDGFGLAVAEALSGLQPRADVVSLGADALALVELMRGRTHVVVVDAIVADGAHGEVSFFDVSSRAPLLEARGTSTHALDAAGAVELARALGELPPRVELVVATARAVEVGAALSPEMRGAAREAAERVAELLAEAARDEGVC